MKFDLQNKDGLTLKTKGKYVREDIAVGLSESDKSALVPENMIEEASVLGVQGSLKKYDGSYEGEAEPILSPVEQILDYDKDNNLQDRSYIFYNTPFWEELENYEEDIVLGNDELAEYNYNPPNSNKYKEFLQPFWRYMFAKSNVKKLPNIIIKTMAYSDGPKTNIHQIPYMFENCVNLEEVNLKLMFKYGEKYNVYLNGDFAFNKSGVKVINLTVPKMMVETYMFNNATNLETLNVINYIDNTEGINFDWVHSSNLNLFSGSRNIKNVKFQSLNINIQIASGSSYGSLLTIESLLSAIQACKANSNTSHKLTVGSVNIAKLADIYVKVVDETNTDYYPFVQCESTDEGAMTIQDYLALKNWTIA